MNSRKYMIIINGEIRTSEVKFCQYNYETKKRDVEFYNSHGKIYSYAYSNVEWLEDPLTPDPNMYRISKDGCEFFDINALYVFDGTHDTYWHICFGDGSERLLSKSTENI